MHEMSECAPARAASACAEKIQLVQGLPTKLLLERIPGPARAEASVG